MNYILACAKGEAGLPTETGPLQLHKRQNVEPYLRLGERGEQSTRKQKCVCVGWKVGVGGHEMRFF